MKKRLTAIILSVFMFCGALPAVPAAAKTNDTVTLTALYDTNTTIPATGIKLDKTSYTLTTKGTSVTLHATVSPKKAANKSVKWSSSDKTVAKVNSSGKVTAVGNGTAVITAKDSAGHKAACKIKVTRADISKGVYNIVKRAYKQINYKWTPVKNVKGFVEAGREVTVFKKGVTYSGIPYGQYVYAGKYVPFDVSFAEFQKAVKNKNSLFYTKRGRNTGMNSVYYGSDCSAFVSYAYNLPRMCTAEIAVSSLFTKVENNNIYNAQVGDCLNKANWHVILITDMKYDSRGNLTDIEISEQTPPIAKKTWYKPYQIRQMYVMNGYTILRYKYRDNVK